MYNNNIYNNKKQNMNAIVVIQINRSTETKIINYIFKKSNYNIDTSSKIKTCADATTL